MFSRCFLDFSVGVRASVIGLSQISSFSLPICRLQMSAPCLGVYSSPGFDSSVIIPFSWCVVAVTLPIWCRSTSSVKPPYTHFRCVAGIHGGCG